MNNEIVRYKARLMLKDYEQMIGRNYNEIYAAVIRSEISRLLLFLVIK
jgi:hypothetical protein